MNKRKEKKSRRYARRCPECGSDMVFTKVKKVGSWYKCTADPFHPKVNFVKTKNKSLNKDAMERRFAGSYGSKR